MFRRFPCLGRSTVGILLLCVGIAVLGTGVADYFIRWKDARRRDSLVESLYEANYANDMDAYANDMDAKSMMANHFPQPPELSDFTLEAISIGVPFFADTTTGMNGAIILKKTSFPVGSVAPDFTVAGAIDKREVHLTDFRNKKPVVLLFGSFGCDVFCGQLPRLIKLHRAYQDQIEFLFVYIKEAPHKNLLPPPTAAEKGLGRISRGLRHFHIDFACLLGNRTVYEAYRPYPLRLVIVDRNGRIALDAGVGLPKGWDLDRVESVLKQL